MYKNYPYRHVSGAAPERQQVNRVHKQYEQQQQREAELAAPLGTGPAWHALWSSMHCEHAGRYGEQPSLTMQCAGRNQILSHPCLHGAGFSVHTRTWPPAVAACLAQCAVQARSLIHPFCPSSPGRAAKTSSSTWL